MKTMPRRKSFFLTMVVALGLLASTSFGLVVGSTDTSEFSDPASPWYGMNWNYVYATGGGTSVAIGNFTLLTADHYYISPSAQFTINGDVFQVISQHELAPDPGETLPPDLHVLKLKNITDGDPLPGYYDIYNGGLAAGRDLLLVGTGHTGTGYGDYYTWDDASSRTRRWGTQDYVTQTRKTMDGYLPGNPDWSTSVFRMNYNETAMPHEVGLADHDSGSGVFYKDATGAWKLAGISLYVDYTGSPGHYNVNWAASMATYAAGIAAFLPDAYPGDFSMDGLVDQADYTTWADTFGWTGAPGGSPADANKDGVIDQADYTVWADRFGQTDPHIWQGTTVDADPLDSFRSPPPSAVGSIPEPASLLLIAASGAILALTRRR